MKRLLCSLLVVTCVTAAAVAQNQPTAEQLQSEITDARKQLAAAQDRKNELAAENEKLRKKVADAEKRLQERTDQLDTLKNRSLYLRQHYDAWQQFIEQNPALRAMWFAYFANDGLKDSITELLGDGKWPFSLPD